jgi:translation initiation factor IF-2
MVRSGVGPINQKDVETAGLLEAQIFGFNTTATNAVHDLATKSGVKGVHSNTVSITLYHHNSYSVTP